MRIGLARIRAFSDAHRLDTFGNHDVGNVVEILEKSLEPQFEIETVPDDQVRPLRAQDVTWCRLIIMDFRVGFGDRFNDRGIASDIPGHVGDDGEGGDGLELAILLVSGASG